MAFGIATQDMNFGISKGEKEHQDIQLTAQASRSETANVASALMSMDEEGMIPDGTPAARVVKDLKAGNFKAMKPGEFRALMQASGVNVTDAQLILNQRGVNLEQYGEEVAGAVRKAQWDADVAPVMQRRIQSTLAAGARSRGIRMSRAQLAVSSQAVTDTIRDMADREDKEIKEAIAKKFEGMGASPVNARRAAHMAFGAASAGAQQVGFKDARHAGGMHSRAALDRIGPGGDVRERAVAGAEAASDAAEASASSSPLTRSMDRLSRPQSTPAEVIAAFGGGVDLSGIRGGTGTAKAAEDQARNDTTQDAGSGVATVRIEGPVQAYLHDDPAAAAAASGASQQPESAEGAGTE
jgi:hypothetical protein